LETAIRRFGDRGFRETSLSAIAREARVSPAAVYAYFPDKEGLFIAAFDHDTNLLIDTVVTQAPVPQLAPWIGLLPRVYAVLPQHPLTRRVLEGAEPDLVPRLFDLSSARRLRQTLAAAIRAAQQAGVARQDIDADVIATGLETLIVATVLAAVQARITGDEDRRAGVLALIVAAIRRPEQG